MKKLFFICAPTDYPWTRSLAHQFFSMGYRVYLEPPDEADDEKVRERTARALYNAEIMVAIVSKESAIGSSAEAFEAWWRPFVDSGRQVIACITPDSPAGAENWIPYDLIRRPHVDFRRAGGAARLAELVTKDGSTAQARPTQASYNDDYEAQFESEPFAYPTQPVAPVEAEPEPESKTSIIRTLLGLVVGLIMVLVIWQMALQSDSGDALIWVGGLAVMVVVVYLIGRWRPQSRSQAAKKLVGYLEVISSDDTKAKGRVYGLINTLTIGTGRRAQIRFNVEGIEKQHCTIFYDGKAYYLENTSNSRTILYDRQLDSGEVVVLQHGDLITVGQAVVLQFRTQL